MRTAIAVSTVTIRTATAGRTFMGMVVDGERMASEINLNHVRLVGCSVTDEATRLLARIAGYRPVGEWKTNDHGDAVVDVAEIDGRCVQCVHGCGCAPTSRRGCGHHQCPAASETQANTCPGAVIHVNARRTMPRFKRNTRRG